MSADAIRKGEKNLIDNETDPTIEEITPPDGPLSEDVEES